MRHFFYRTFALFLLTQCFVLFSYAKEKLTYSRFPMVRHGKKFDYPNQLKVSGEKLNIKINPKMGTHFLLGIDQLYVSKNLKKKILVKQDVVLSSKKKLNEWIKLSSGSVFHFEKNKKIVAVYAEGYHERALSEIERQFVNSRIKKVSFNKSKYFLNLFFECAYAEVAPSGWSEDWNWQGTDMAPPVGVVDNAPRNDDAGESLARCLLRQTGSSLYDIGSSAVDTVSNAASAVWNDPLGAARATGSYLYGVGESTVSGVYNAGSAVVSYCLDTCLDVDQMWADAGDAVDSMYQLGVQLVDRVSSAITGFAELPPAVKNRLICEVGGQMIANFGVNAVLSFLGGSAVAAPRIALMLNNLQEKIERGLGALMALGRSNLSVQDQQQLVTDYMKGNVTSDEILAMLNQGPANTNDAPELRVAASVDPEAPTPVVSPTSIQALTDLESLYMDQNITITSLRGNTYSGELVEIVRDATSGEMVMVLKNTDGTTQSLRVSNLNLSSIVGAQNAYTMGQNGILQPNLNSALGAEINNFRTSSGLNLVVDPNVNTGTAGFHINYESGRVVIDRAVLNDPTRLSTMIRTTLPNAFARERQVRSNLRDNHGVFVGPGGILQSTNPTSTLGRMVAGLERQGVRISIDDPNLRSMNAGGLAYNGRYLSIDSRLFLPGNEANLMGVLRHEIRHTTTVRGSERYPLVDPNNPIRNPSPESLAYAGRNIQFTSESGDGAQALTSSGMHELYSTSFRADEYDARLTQFPRNNLNTDPNLIRPSERGGDLDTSRAFLQGQGELLYEIQRNNLVPLSYSRYGASTIARYRVQRNGAYYLIDIPLTGPITGNIQAERLARQVVDARVRYLSRQHTSRTADGTFTSP